MRNKVFYKHCDILFLSLLLICFSARTAWAHGEIAVIISYGPFFLGTGMITACLFSALSKKHPIISSIAGMFLGIFLGTLALLLWAGGFEFFWDDLKLFLTIGLLIYFVPATLIGIAIGFLFKRFKKKG